MTPLPPPSPARAAPASSPRASASATLPTATSRSTPASRRSPRPRRRPQPRRHGARVRGRATARRSWAARCAAGVSRVFVIDKIDHLESPWGRRWRRASRASSSTERRPLRLPRLLDRSRTGRRLAAPGGGFDQLRGGDRRRPRALRGDLLAPPRRAARGDRLGPLRRAAVPDRPVRRTGATRPRSCPSRRPGASARSASRPSAPASCSATPRATAVRCRRARAARCSSGGADDGDAAPAPAVASRSASTTR